MVLRWCMMQNDHWAADLAESHHQIARVARKKRTEVDLGATHARRGERVPGEHLPKNRVHSPCDVRVYWREILTFTSTSIFGVHSSPRLPRHTSRSSSTSGTASVPLSWKSAPFRAPQASRTGWAPGQWCCHLGHGGHSRKHNLHNYLAQVVSIQYCWIRRDGYF